MREQPSSEFLRQVFLNTNAPTRKVFLGILEALEALDILETLECFL